MTWQPPASPSGPLRGKLDFHACRAAFVTLLFEGDATVKEVQHLARHSTLQLTMNVYGRVRNERIPAAIEHLGDRLAPEEVGTAACAHGVHASLRAPRTESATPWKTEGCAFSTMVAAEGIEPPTRGL